MYFYFFNVVLKCVKLFLDLCNQSKNMFENFELDPCPINWQGLCRTWTFLDDVLWLSVAKQIIYQGKVVPSDDQFVCELRIKNSPVFCICLLVRSRETAERSFTGARPMKQILAAIVSGRMPLSLGGAGRGKACRGGSKA